MYGRISVALDGFEIKKKNFFWNNFPSMCLSLFNMHSYSKLRYQLRKKGEIADHNVQKLFSAPNLLYLI